MKQEVTYDPHGSRSTRVFAVKNGRKTSTNYT